MLNADEDVGDDARTAPLKEWNRLARENTENAIVASMFEAAAASSEPIDSFSTWLLVGSAATASFCIVNAEKLMPLLGQCGFLVSGALLCLSCLFGLLSKIYALRCKVSSAVGAAVRETFAEHLRAYEEEEKQIDDGAKFWGITLETEVRLERILAEFSRPFPKVAIWLVNRKLHKDVGNPQIGYLFSMRTLMTQSLLASIQAVLALGFLVAGFVSATISY